MSILGRIRAGLRRHDSPGKLAARILRLGPVGAGKALARWARGGPLLPPRRIDPLFLGSLPRDESTRVSVVVACHDERRFIADCLRSVADQSWENWECIVVDDASTDGGAEDASRRFGGDPRFRFVYSEQNLGLAGARNLGLALATGRYVTFLDGDDFLYPDALASRLEALQDHTDEPWVVGSYCNWHSVPEDASPRSHGPEVARRWPVHWLTLRLGAPFIASAPLLKIDPVRAAGGFDPDVPTAEDFEFWSRLLRNGYVVVPVAHNGIGYRQKRQSMFRLGPAEHARQTARTIVANDTADPVRTVFADAAHAWEQQAAIVQRWLVALTGAVYDGRRQAIDPVLAELERRWRPELSIALDHRATVGSAARRLVRSGEDPDGLLSDDLARRTTTVLEPLVAQGLVDLASLLPGPVSPVIPAAHREAKVRPRLGSDDLAGAAVLFPSSAYHLDELGPLAEQLAIRGERPVFMATDRAWSACQSETWKYGFDTVKWREPGPWVDLLRLVVTMNDWGPESSTLVETANAAGVATFGKVEGVQDFADVDVHWQRYPYTRVGHVLAQGPNDLAAPVAPSRLLVGSSRLERIWQEPPGRRIDGPVIVNLNFTYHVLEEHRDAWLAGVVEALRRSEVPFLVSRHPAEKSELPGLPVASDPMRHLLKDASLLISRFSTVPFEAMARGVPFVYHNPHGEKVPTFSEPNGAFPVTVNVDELVSAINAARQVDDYRAVAREFFLAQVDVTDEPSEVRAARAILEVV